MQTLHAIEDLGRQTGRICLAAGYFDGVHLGHQEVIRRTRACAAATGGEAWVLTFDTHPLKVLRPRAAPLLLTSNRHKLRLLAHLGVDGCLMLPFTPEVAATDPERFLDRLARGAPGLAQVLVGENWRFGRGGRGDVKLLRQWGAARGCGATAVAPVLWHGEPVSSTRVRQAITHGHLQAAAAMLGRPFSVLGTVQPGQGLGRRMGFPTANVDPEGEVRPPAGVYAVRAVTAGATFAGVAYYGTRPTIEAGPPLLEAHFFDTQADLYGRELEVLLFARLRAEQRFESSDALAAQIARDAEDARRALEDPQAKKVWVDALQTWYGPL